MANPEDFLDKSIREICGNGYADDGHNHCAHFVSHVARFDRDMTCRKLVSGATKPGANVRVHEVFARCAEAGEWPGPADGGDDLIFVTKKENVDVDKKTMVNIPKKHIGIYRGGFVYHYSNSRDKVVKQTVPEFQRTFDKTYGPGQGYFWGRMKTPAPVVAGPPASTPAAVAAVPAPAAAGHAPVTYMFEKDGDHHYAVAGNDRFYVGTTTRQFRGGLMQIKSKDAGAPYFKAADYAATIGHWAQLLEITGAGESQNRMTCVNAYDRAAFTFGFYQLAAHTPQDNLILLFREMTKLPLASRYIPNLSLQDGRLHLRKAGQLIDLETVAAADGENQLTKFMAMLNPSQPEVEIEELDWSARLMDWTRQDPQMRAAQVRVSCAILSRKVETRYDKWYNLDGVSDTIVAVIADIHHQGRAKKTAVAAALAKPGPAARLNALIDIGNETTYGGRQRTLRKAIESGVAAGRLGQHRWSRASGDFVPA
jgi:hypothetical protein